MKTIALFMLLIAGIFGVITAITRPDILERKYMEIREPYDRYKEEKLITTWREEKERERTAWMIKQEMPNDCRTPKTAIRKMECKNIAQINEQTFERIWANKIRNGFKPDGIEN